MSVAGGGGGTWNMERWKDEVVDGRGIKSGRMIIITGHWGCARVEGCIVSRRGQRWQAPRFQRGVRPYNWIGISHTMGTGNLMESDGARVATPWTPPPRPPSRFVEQRVRASLLPQNMVLPPFKFPHSTYNY